MAGRHAITPRHVNRQKWCSRPVTRDGYLALCIFLEEHDGTCLPMPYDKGVRLAS